MWAASFGPRLWWTPGRNAPKAMIGPEELREVEDEAIAEVVRQQEDIGLQGITDGEFRRFMFHVDFLEQLDGVTVTEGNFLARFHRLDGSEIEFSPPTMGVDGPIRHARPIQGPDFDYLASQVTKTPKVSIPAPSMLHFRGGRQGISEEVYPDLEQFFDDLTAAYREEIADLASRGARYIQMDDTNLAYLCDPEVRERTAARGDDPDDLTRLYSRLVSDAFAGRPDDMVAAIHLCRGNFQSAWVTKGGYEPVAEILFNEMDVDAFFLEYDDERSGDFAPLRFVPANKMVVLGLMSSKLPDVEARRRGQEADRGGGGICVAGPARLESSVWVLFHGPRQQAEPRRPMAEAGPHRRGGSRRLGLLSQLTDRSGRIGR